MKRKNQTFFVPVVRSSSFLEVKEAISSALGSSAITQAPNVASSNVMLYMTQDASKELPDSGFISDHMVENDAVVYAVFRPDGGSWEVSNFVFNLLCMYSCANSTTEHHQFVMSEDLRTFSSSPI